jgi:hypothetical protein
MAMKKVADILPLDLQLPKLLLTVMAMPDGTVHILCFSCTEKWKMDGLTAAVEHAKGHV